MQLPPRGSVVLQPDLVVAGHEGIVIGQPPGRPAQLGPLLSTSPNVPYLAASMLLPYLRRFQQLRVASSCLPGEAPYQPALLLAGPEGIAEGSIQANLR